MWSFLKSKRTLAREAQQRLEPDLRKLQKDLQALDDISDPLERFVKFFAIISTWQDRGLSELKEAFIAANGHKHQFAGKLNKINTLTGHFHQAGRNPYGLNRTEPGVTPTIDSVYLGNYHDTHPQEAMLRSYLLTKTVGEYMQDKDELPESISRIVLQFYDSVTDSITSPAKVLTYRQAGELQALSFMKHYITPINQTVDDLLALDINSVKKFILM